LRALYADDAYEEDVSTGERTVGPDAIVEVSRLFRRGFPNLRMSVDRVHGSGDLVTLETKFQGTHTGPAVWGNRELPPTNRTVTFGAAEVFKVRDGKIIGVRMYYDVTGVLQQMTSAEASG
jgi:predicted ester cyclase